MALIFGERAEQIHKEGGSELFSKEPAFFNSAEPAPAFSAPSTQGGENAQPSVRQIRKQRRDSTLTRQAECSNVEPAAVPSTSPGRPKGQSAPVTDDVNRLDRTIFVGNVPATCKRKALHSFFAHQTGYSVESVRLRSVSVDPNGTMPRKGKVLQARLDSEINTAHAYVVFREKVGAEAALPLNMCEFADRHIRIDRATSPSNRSGKVEYDRQRTLFVGRIRFDATDEELVSIFSGGESYAKELGNQLEAVRLIKDKRTGHGKGVAYVLYKTANAAKFALTALQGVQLHERELRIQKPLPTMQSQGTNAASIKGSKRVGSPSQRDEHTAVQKASSYNQAKRRKRSNENANPDASEHQQRTSRAMAPYEGARTRAGGALKGPQENHSSALSVDKLKKEAAGDTKTQRDKAKKKKSTKKAHERSAARISQRKRPAVAAKKKQQQQQKKKSA